MDINISTFMYLFLRLCPFILVCFFTIGSIFNNDLKGIVYLMGLIFAIGVIIIISSLIKQISVSPFPNFFDIGNTDDPICKIVSFGSSEFSQMPVGSSIIIFTFIYLLTNMIYVGSDEGTDLVRYNWPTVLFFSILIVADWYNNTNISNIVNSWFNAEYKELPYCYNWLTTLFAYSVGGLLGWAWLAIMYSTKTPELLYFGKYKNNEKCEKVSQTQYKCKVFKEGKEVNIFPE
jgi:hypothetical protein